MKSVEEYEQIWLEAQDEERALLQRREELRLAYDAAVLDHVAARSRVAKAENDHAFAKEGWLRLSTGFWVRPDYVEAHPEIEWEFA